MFELEWLRPGVFLGSILYALVGVVMFWVSFIVVDKLTPYDLWGEIVEKKNVALAIVVAVPGVTPRAVARWPIGSNRLSPPGPTEPV